MEVVKARVFGKNLSFASVRPAGAAATTTVSIMFKAASFDHAASPTPFPRRKADLVPGTVAEIAAVAQPDLRDPTQSVLRCVTWRRAAAAGAVDASAFVRGVREAVGSGEMEAPLCRRWSLGQCVAARCPFRHHFATEAERRRTERVEQQRTASRRRQEAINVAYRRGDEHTDVFVRVKKDRGKVFAAWLVERFGRQRLAAGAGVLDVAGGRGQLADALTAAGLPVTVIDPYQRPVTARRLRKRQSTYRSLQEEFDGAGFVDRHRALVEDCSALVGLHPDQPTVEIVEVARRFGKPFAVVPCCAFAALFPERRLRDGRALASTEDVCQFLLEQAPGAASAFLPFAGRNKAIFGGV